MMEAAVDQHVSEFESRLRQQYQDLSLKDYLELTGMTMEQLRDEYEPQAKKEVLLRLALEKIADTEDIQVSDEELDEALAEFAGQMQVPVEMVHARIPREDYRTDLRVQKVVEMIKSNAVVDNELAAAPAEETAAEEAPAEEAAAE